MSEAEQAVELIAIDKITILNPRVRNRRVFEELVTSIAHLGLKKPITVSPAPAGGYNLVCGQGRLEAYLALGQAEIPAIVIEAGEDDCLVMSLVENLARRQHTPLELVRGIGMLKQRGYSVAEIAEKTDLSPEYAYALCYAKALLAATRQNELAQPDKPKKVGKMTPEQMARLEREMETLNQDFRALEASYGDDVLQLVISAGYVGRLISNASVQQYLVKRHPELLEELRGIVSASSLDQAIGAPAKVAEDERPPVSRLSEPETPPVNGYRSPPGDETPTHWA